MRKMKAHVRAVCFILQIAQFFLSDMPKEEQVDALLNFIDIYAHHK